MEQNIFMVCRNMWCQSPSNTIQCHLIINRGISYLYNHDKSVIYQISLVIRFPISWPAWNHWIIWNGCLITISLDARRILCLKIGSCVEEAKLSSKIITILLSCRWEIRQDHASQICLGLATFCWGAYQWTTQLFGKFHLRYSNGEYPVPVSKGFKAVGPGGYGWLYIWE